MFNLLLDGCFSRSIKILAHKKNSKTRNKQ